jgi:hypothetical protein
MERKSAYTTQRNPRSIKELAVAYGVTRQIIRKWLLPIQGRIGQREGHFYTVAQMIVIIEHLGPPDKVFGIIALAYISW